uniref:helix-turn-helix transcriptional regulator n=1 Tax=Acetatifactor sp. TaxID=1872090 RepID=UPI0040573DCC
MDLSKEWYRSEFVKHESMLSHTSVENEFNNYIAIAEGNLDYVIKNQDDDSFRNPEGKGRLSENELQNLRYHFVVATAMITRYCVMNGMELEKAYNLSDFYILKMDKSYSISEIVDLHNAMCFDFCNKMNILKKSQVLSKPVVLCMDYIYSHIHSRITIKQLAEHTDLSESYLSKLFCKEIGMPVSTYITLQKIEKAKNMLSYSDYALADIANYLAFSSQSHFIQVFQKHVGVTPHKYRDKHFRNQWEHMTAN